MKNVKKLLAVLLTATMLICAFSVAPVSAKGKFVKLNTGKVTTGKFTKKNKINYYKLKIKKKSKVSFLAYNGNLEQYYTAKCKVYKDKALTNRVYKTDLRVTDTDVWCPYKKLKAGKYYITLKSKDKFQYNISCDILPVK